MIAHLRQAATSIAAAIVITVATAAAATAQWVPDRPINIVVPYGAGGGTDSFARALSASADKVLPVPLVIVNKPGSSGLIGASEVKRARPDGQTLMVTSTGSLVLTTMLQNTDLDPINDFRIIGQIGDLTTGLVVAASSEMKTAADFIKHAKENQGKLRWGHTGRGSFHYIAGQAFLDAQGIKAQDVPFKGGGAVRAALIGEQVDFVFMGVQQRAGFEEQVRFLGLNSPERDVTVKDVPTFAEQGLEYADVSSPILLMAPLETPDEVVTTMEDALKKITASEHFKEIMLKNGNAPGFLTGEDAKKRLEALKKAAAPVVEKVRK